MHAHKEYHVLILLALTARDIETKVSFMVLSSRPRFLVATKWVSTIVITIIYKQSKQYKACKDLIMKQKTFEELFERKTILRVPNPVGKFTIESKLTIVYTHKILVVLDTCNLDK